MRDTNDLFLRAAREKFRFTSKVGALTVEDLWDLPLSKTNGLDLDSVAKAVNAELKAAAEESFVTPPNNAKRGPLEAKLEIVKTIIAVKQDEAKAAQDRAHKAQQKKMIADAIAAAQARDLSNASMEDLVAKLKALEAEGV
jgi:hypothetical protein